MPFEYGRNPIIEAVFEFAPAGGSVGNNAMEQLQAHFAPTYAGRQDSIAVSGGFELETGPSGIRAARALPAGPARRRMWNAESSRLVQFGPDMFVFNALRPYSHFENYLPAMEDGFRTYARIAGAPSVAFLGQRYINQIVLPSQSEDPCDYFRMYPRLHVTGAQQRHPPFALQLQAEEIKRGQVVLTLTYQGLDAEQRPTYLLDVYARTVDNPGIDFAWERVQAWQELAHVAVGRTFDFALGERSYTLLDRREVP
jgi:uncharacterized protein (TIGR04255 family)